MISNNGNFANIQNRNFSQMLDDINFNLSSFPLISHNNGNNVANSSNNAQLQDRSSGLLGVNDNNEQSSSQLQQTGVYHQRYQQNKNPSNRYDSQNNNYSRNRENNNLYSVNDVFQIQNHQSNNTRKKQASSPKIQDILTCFICLGKLKNAHMCPDCQKMCCEGCIKEWLSNKSQCPHCRSHLRPSKLMKCRFVSEITTALEKIEQIEQKNEKQGFCQEHENPLQYYCQICKHPVCSDCGMIGPKHKNHKFEKLNTVYDFHVKQVKQELVEVGKKLTQLNKQQNEVDLVIEKLSKIRDDKSQSLSQQMEHVSIKLNDLLKSKLEKLTLQRGPIQEEIELLENMSEEINYHIESLPKSTLINKSNDMIQTLEEINNRRVIKNYINESDKKLDFYYDIIPSYDSADFFLENYSVKKRSVEVVYSETLFAHGNEWRLKVYLNGKDKAKDNYLSIFVEMTKGSMKDSNFEYRVEMVNQINPDLRVIRQLNRNQVFLFKEFISPFKTGDTWGYERFFKLDQLEQEGYLLPESDMLILKYYVRSPSYSQFCQSKQSKIEELELKNQQLMEEIKILQNPQNQNQDKFSQSDSLNVGQEGDQSKSIDESKAENFELENFINEIEHSNISNIRSDFENYLKQRNLEEFEKSDHEVDEKENHENEDVNEDDNLNEDENIDEDGDFYEDEEQQNYYEENDERSQDEDSIFSGRDEEYKSNNNQERNQQVNINVVNDIEDNIYEYKCSVNNRNKNLNRQINNQDTNLESETINQMQLDEFDKINEQIARIQLNNQEEVNSQDLSYLKDEEELNNIAHDIQDLLNQETDKVINRINFENKQINNDELEELELYCKMEEEVDCLEQMNSNQYNNNDNNNQQQFYSNKGQIKQNNLEMVEPLQKYDGKSPFNDEQAKQQEQQQKKEIDYRLRWNGIMQNMNKVIQGNSTTNNYQNSSTISTNNNKLQMNLLDQVINNNQEFLFEENKCVDNENSKQNILTQQNEDIYSCLDEIGDKVKFIPINQIENFKQLNDSSILVKKNLLPEFEQEAFKLVEKKSQSQIQNKLSEGQQNDKIKNNQFQHNTRLTINSLAQTSSSNQIIQQKNTILENTQSQITLKNKNSNYDESLFFSKIQPSVNSTQEQFKILPSDNNKFFKDNGVTKVNNQEQEDFKQSRYDSIPDQKKEKQNNSYHTYNQKNEVLNHKNDTQNIQYYDSLINFQRERINSMKSESQFNLKKEGQNISSKELNETKKNESNDMSQEGQNNMRSGRLYVQQINVKKVEGKDNYQSETQLQKYNLRKNDGDSQGNLINDKKEQVGTLQNSVSSQQLQIQQLNSHRMIQQANNKEDNSSIGPFSNPNPSRIITSHSKKEVNNEDALGSSQYNQIKSGTIFSVSGLNTNNNTTSKRYSSLQQKNEKSEIVKKEDDENEDSLEKENKDDSLLIMEKQIQKLENLNKQEEDQKLQVSITQQRILQNKELKQQINIPSQQHLAEARKLLISSINFPEDFLKKVNKVKSYGNMNQVQNQQTAKNQCENKDSNSSQTNLMKDPMYAIQNDISQKKNLLLKPSASEINISQNKSIQLTSNNSVVENNTKTSQIHQLGNIVNKQSQQNVNQNMSDGSDIKKQEELIKKLESLVVENNNSSQ